MQFNLDPNKQPQEVYFSKKANNVSSHSVSFNNTKVVSCSSQKHLGLVLDQELNFNDDIQSKITKCYKMIGIIKRLSVNIPGDALLRIYKSFISPIWTAEILFMTNVLMSNLKIKLKILSTKLVLQ